jgi:AraC-like DNA-binding protein
VIFLNSGNGRNLHSAGSRSAGKFEQLSAPSVACQLGMGERMLHRQLAACGARFRDLRNSVMLDSARLLLSDNRHSVTETALALGFSETNAFSRAFRQLSGLSPAQFRKI